MTHMLTASGAEYHLDGLASLMPGNRPILLQDIAHQLAIVNRFNGATSRPYSVAEHSVFVADIAQTNGESLAVQMAALMHDAHETYTQDMIQPIKAAVDARALAHGGPAVWREFEREHATAVRNYFGLRTIFAGNRVALRRFDLEALATERRDLMNYHAAIHQPWDVLGDGQDDPALVFRPIEWASLNTPERAAQPWQFWRQAFLDRFASLTEGMGNTEGQQRHLKGLA